MTHDFESWRDLSANAPDHEVVTTISFKIRIPRVIVLLVFDRLPKKEVKFTRHNVFERDKNTCQVLRRDFRSQRTQSGSRRAARSWRNNHVGERGLLVYQVQYAQRQPASARSAHEPDSQTQATEVAAVRACHIFGPAARSLEALRRSRVLERRIERLVSLSCDRDLLER